MSTLITLTGSLDDIVFEGRNKAYGAFQLRRSYQRHLGSALFIAITACSLLLLLPLAIHYFYPEVTVKPTTSIPNVLPTQPGNYVLPKTKPLVPPTPAAVPPAVTVTPHSTIQTHVVPDPEVKPTTASDLPQGLGPVGPATTGAENTTGATGSIGTATGTGTGVDTARPAPAAAPEAVLTAEVMPDFVGGRAALQRYLQKHLRFPAAALAAQASGRVFVSFVVQTDGSIGEVTVLKGLGYGTEEAAARVVREMPAWTPGLQNHRPVAVRFTLPITFQFE
ncbi:energy transducer TonB [Hymenobacter rubidus]|uniref:energy transducer TonB n=1 Tax=Hymenobacter rubidus TaxID=1441626 RepID=UPI00191EEE0E|nr:energy transducer TonB [Hymenobacter rubidus]